MSRDISINRRALLVFMSKMGALTAEEITALHPAARIDVLENMVRERLLIAHLGEDWSIRYKITARGRITCGLDAHLPIAQPRTFVPSGNLGDGDLPSAVMRPGANDHLMYPSRIGNRRVWRDGRVETIKEAA